MIGIIISKAEEQGLVLINLNCGYKNFIEIDRDGCLRTVSESNNTSTVTWTKEEMDGMSIDEREDGVIRLTCPKGKEINSIEVAVISEDDMQFDICEKLFVKDPIVRILNGSIKERSAVNVQFNGISWDTDEEDVKLPSNVIVQIPYEVYKILESEDYEEDYEEMLMNEVSDHYGFCFFGYEGYSIAPHDATPHFVSSLWKVVE